MNIPTLLALRDEYNKRAAALSPVARESFERAFDIEYAHSSTAIEGNTLTLIQTKSVIEDGLAVGGKTLREIFEVRNHDRAFAYVKECVAAKKPLDEAILKNIHAILMENILVGGVYRSCEVRITGALHKPPPPSQMHVRIKSFFDSLPVETARLDTITLAAYTHAEFVAIHPFEDGNGRTARLLMNYRLMSGGFPPISIEPSRRLEYFEALDKYPVTHGTLVPFTEFIANILENTLREFIATEEPTT